MPPRRPASLATVPAPQLDLLSYRPPPRILAPPPASEWPELWKTRKEKVFGPVTSRGKTVEKEHWIRRRITVMSGAEFRDKVLALGTLGASVPVQLPDVNAYGAPFRWPKVEDEWLLRFLVSVGALVVVSDSGGKDSQAMAILLRRIVPPAQLVHIHADLPGLEWPGTKEKAQDHARRSGAPFIVVQAERGLLDWVRGTYERRPEVPSWPDAMNRYCTKSQKVAPIEHAITRYAKERGFRIIVDAAGLRAEESTNRKEQPIWRLHEQKSKLARLVRKQPVPDTLLWLKYLPIHGLTVRDVWYTIEAAGEWPHMAYLAGNERLSCVFCVLGTKADLTRGALYNPELLETYDETEKHVGWTFRKGQPLTQIVGMTPAEAKAKRRHLPVATGRFEVSMVSGQNPETPPSEDCNDEWVRDEGDTLDDDDDDAPKENRLPEGVCHMHLAQIARAGRAVSPARRRARR